ncbi:MAG: M20/M25/M40 family metallo-hydrolase [Bacteroidetes bacterium]|nr:MAG: M20/M25/M40 family metallo-hydrolase [Bacteroidota bacterium]
MSSIETYTEESLELLAQLLKIPALSGQEAAKADALEAWLQERQYEVQRFGNNLVMSHNPNVELKVLLHSHIDTVKPASSWTQDPYAASWENGKLTALGSNDAGASVISMLAAFRYLKSINWPYGLYWVAGAEEENSGSGGLSALLPHLPEFSLAIAGEPTSLKAAVAEKGLMVIDGEVKGVAGHAAREEGVNAIYEALADIEFFRDYRFEKDSEFLGPVKMNLTVAQAGEKHNSIPDSFRYTVDVRLNEMYTHEEVLEIVQSHCKGQLSMRSNRLKPSATPVNHPVRTALRNMAIEQYGSPTLSDQALMPWPSLKMGPGDSARSHTADEFILDSEIKEAVQTYIQLLQNTYSK